MAVIEKNGTYMALPMAIKRGNAISLDTTAIWYSLEELQNYARTGATAYCGQIVALVDEASNTAKAYIIANTAGDLQEVGSATVGDNKTIILKDDGALALKNWGVEYYKWVDPVGTEGEEGYVAGYHVKQIVDQSNPWIAGLEPKSIAGADGSFELAWYQPSTTTVEGLSSTVSSIKTSVDAINGALGNAETEGTIRYDIANKVDKANGKSLISNDLITKVEGLANVKSIGDNLTLSDAGVLSAQANVISGALLGDTVSEINEEKQIVIPVATGALFGLVKSSTDADKVAIAEDGTMSVNSYSATKLYIPEGDELVLNGGNA